MYAINDFFSFFCIMASWGICRQSGLKSGDVSEGVTFDISGDAELARKFGFHRSDLAGNWFVLLACKDTVTSGVRAFRIMYDGSWGLILSFVSLECLDRIGRNMLPLCLMAWDLGVAKCMLDKRSLLDFGYN